MKERQKLAQEKKKTEELEVKKEICDNCKFGTWNTDFYNLDCLGEPITLRCPNYESGDVGIIRGSSACNKFIKK